MQCPTCHEEMTIKQKAITSNMKDGKQLQKYTSITYWCKKDDVWVVVETPIEKDEA